MTGQTLTMAEVAAYTRQAYPDFGVNKHRELTRLLFEIARRESVPFAEILPQSGLTQRQFQPIKHYLLRRRYPALTRPDRYRAQVSSGLPQSVGKAHPDPATDTPGLRPRRVLVEEAVRGAPVVERLRRLFPSAALEPIHSYKEYRQSRPFTLRDYHQRRELLVVVQERFDFCLPCPCTPGAVGCGYQILNIGYGCPYDCSYCFLQGYTNAPGLVIPGNLDDFFTAIQSAPAGRRFGSGQFTDSLAMDHITGFSSQIISFFAQHPQWTFEFKTKSNRIQHLLEQEAPANVLVGWSVNPDEISAVIEGGACSPAERLEAAGQCAAAGYGLTFHLDPIVLVPDWQELYANLIRRIYERFTPGQIIWISLGTLRMTTRLRQAIESRFPHDPCLDAELIPGYDGKLRYPDEKRVEVYRHLLREIRKYDPVVRPYLCMEHPAIWDGAGLSRPACLHVRNNNI